MIRDFTKWLNENSDYSTSDQLADLEHLYDLGMISAEDLIRDRITISASLGQLTKLTQSEISILDSELEQEIEEWVTENALDIIWDLYDSPEEEKVFDDYIMETSLEFDWQVYLDGTIDVSVFREDLGHEQRISWTEADGTVKSRGILEYYKEPIVSHLDPTAITGRIRLSRYEKRLVQEMVSDLTNSDN